MKIYKEIEGWFDHESAYDYIIENIPKDGTIVELGAWLGKSSAYLCDNAPQNIIIIDTLKGSPNELQTFHKLATETDIYNIFQSNMEGREYTAIRETSLQASKQFEDNSLDAVFIDLTHTYEEVKQDILTWLPKVKQGGILGGDDYHEVWPGVIQAVKELLPDSLIIGDCYIYCKS